MTDPVEPTPLPTDPAPAPPDTNTPAPTDPDAPAPPGTIPPGPGGLSLAFHGRTLTNLARQSRRIE